MAKSRSKRQVTSGYDRFMALSDAEKERVWESYNREIPLSEMRPLNARERAEWERARRGKIVSLEEITIDVERGLLRRADQYAKANGLTRAQLVAKGLTAVIAGAAPARARATSPRRRKAS